MIELSCVADISILHLYGEISLLEMEMVLKQINDLRRCDRRQILINLAEVDHLHFKAVKHLASQAKLLKNEDGSLKLACVNEAAKEVIRFTGADQTLEDYNSVADAILSFMNRKTPEELLQ